jgi:hypothetical protein
VYYLLKIKGVKGKSDYIQIRDENFTLIAYFRLDNLHRTLVNAKLERFEIQINDMLLKAEYGKICILKLET